MVYLWMGHIAGFGRQPLLTVPMSVLSCIISIETHMRMDTAGLYATASCQVDADTHSAPTDFLSDTARCAILLPSNTQDWAAL